MQMFQKQTPVRIAALLLLLLSALVRSQSSGFFAAVFAFLPVSCTVCLAMFETPPAAVAYGLFAGVLWDFASPAPDGFFSVWLSLTAFAVVLAVRLRIRRKATSALAGTALFSVLTAVLLSLMTAGGFQEQRAVFAVWYLPDAVLSLLFAPVWFWIFRTLYGSGRGEKVI